jgi:hypothetical protein
MLNTRIILFLLYIILFSSCASNNEEELYTSCETHNVTYSVHIKPYIENSCLSCHNTSLQSGNVNYSSFKGVKETVDDGSFLGSTTFVILFSDASF